MDRVNFCNECRHFQPMQSMCGVGGFEIPTYDERFFVQRPRPVTIQFMPARNARAYHAQTNMIDPVAECPKWEERCSQL